MKCAICRLLRVFSATFTCGLRGWAYCGVNILIKYEVRCGAGSEGGFRVSLVVKKGAGDGLHGLPLPEVPSFNALGIVCILYIYVFFSTSHRPFLRPLQPLIRLHAIFSDDHVVPSLLPLMLLAVLTHPLPPPRYPCHRDPSASRHQF